MTERTATREEWAELVEQVRAKNPRMAKLLEAGVSFVGLDGVRVHPPLGYAADDEAAIVRKTTITAELPRAPHASAGREN